MPSTSRRFLWMSHLAVAQHLLKLVLGVNLEGASTSVKAGTVDLVPMVHDVKDVSLEGYDGKKR